MYTTLLPKSTHEAAHALTHRALKPKILISKQY